MTLRVEDNRWSFAAGYTIAQLEKLDFHERNRFDTLNFQRFGPDQVTFGEHHEQEWKALHDRIA